MPKPQLLINQRFVINEDLHTLKDLQTNTSTRLELRLLLVICALTKQAGEVVSRQQLINDIWDNYGGAEEGLNQAISTLRKLLDDVDKKLIETVPKKGYRLHAEVRIQEQSRTTFGRYVFFTGILLVIGWLLIKTLGNRDQALNKEPSGAVMDTTYQQKELDSVRKSDSINRKN